MLANAHWEGVELGALIDAQTGARNDPRISRSGPKVMLPPQLVSNLALVFNELATNARTHGALATTYGRVTIDWKVESKPDPFLTLRWSEQGSTVLDREKKFRGFGTRLIEHSMKSAPGGSARMHIDGHGVSWELAWKLPSVSIDGSSAINRRDRLNPRRILLVEDEPLIALELSEALEMGGFEVVGPSATLEEALSLATFEKLDMALLDAKLGDKPIDEVAAVLVRLNIPFAFVTGYGRESLPVAFASAPLLRKPVKSDELLSFVDKVLSATHHPVSNPF